MPGPIVQIRCSQCQRFYNIRRRDIKRIKGEPLCGECRGVGPNNPNWKDGISRDRGRYSAEMRRRHPEHYRARRMAERARRSGRLVPQPCEICGALKVEMHHDDYSQPYHVHWLCPTCHDIVEAIKKALIKWLNSLESASVVDVNTPAGIATLGNAEPPAKSAMPRLGAGERAMVAAG